MSQEDNHFGEMNLPESRVEIGDIGQELTTLSGRLIGVRASMEMNVTVLLAVGLEQKAAAADQAVEELKRMEDSIVALTMQQETAMTLISLAIKRVD